MVSASLKIPVIHIYALLIGFGLMTLMERCRNSRAGQFDSPLKNAGKKRGGVNT